MTDRPEKPLEFEDDAGASRAMWLGLGAIVLLVVWMATGPLASDGPAPPEKHEPEPFTVGFRPSTAEEIAVFVGLEGQALPDAETPIMAEATAQVAELPHKVGDHVESGAVLARFNAGPAEAELARARDELTRVQRDYDNAVELRDRGVATEDRVVQANSALVTAEAQLQASEDALDRYELTAPFAGRIESLDVKLGQFVSAGAQVARLIDNDPLIVQTSTPQRDRLSLREGQIADVLFATGENVKGTVTFVAQNADAATRSFRTEITVDNADGAIPAGISAGLQIETGETMAHFISPSTLSLDENGVLGVKVVGEGDVVEFHEVEIVQALPDGVRISGLPEEARIITIGQGFVRTGDTVAPVEDDILSESDAP